MIERRHPFVEITAFEAVAVEVLYFRDQMGFEKRPKYSATLIVAPQNDFKELIRHAMSIIWKARELSGQHVDKTFLGVVIQHPKYPALKRVVRHPLMGNNPNFN